MPAARGSDGDDGGGDYNTIATVPDNMCRFCCCCFPATALHHGGGAALALHNACDGQRNAFYTQ